MAQTDPFLVGRTRVQKLHELDLNGFTATELFPALDPQFVHRHPDWVPAATYGAEDHITLSVHSWLVHHQDMTLLIDTGAGNDKARPGLKVLDHLQNPYLERLAQTGVQPEQVTHVLLTHIHADHVGWNTSCERGVWRPTFPNAAVICSGREWQYSAALAAGDETAVAELRHEAALGSPIRIPTPGVFHDSMQPLEATGRLRLIEVNGAEVLPGVRFVGTAGHSIDHAAIEIASDGKLAIFGGDVMHHPLEVYNPQVVSMFCEFPEAVRRSRLALLERASKTEALYFSSHFPLSSAGRIDGSHGAYRWTFLDGHRQP